MVCMTYVKGTACEVRSQLDQDKRYQAGGKKSPATLQGAIISDGKGTTDNKHTHGRTLQLLDRICPVGRFGENHNGKTLYYLCVQEMEYKQSFVSVNP